MLRDIIANPVELHDDGMLDVPQSPGLGIEVNEDALKKYRVS